MEGCQRAACRGRGDGCVRVSLCFVSRIGWAGRWRFCLVFPSRVGVPFAFFLIGVQCRRFVPPSRVGVPCRCCPVAPFLSARLGVSFHLFLSPLLFLFVFRPVVRVGWRCVVWSVAAERGVICREAGGCGVAICGAWRRGGAWAVR